MNVSDPQVQAAIISVLGSAITSLAAGIFAFIVGRQISERRSLLEKLEVAKKDIEFLLEVEQIHCEHNIEREGKSLKNTMRGLARERGSEWSGKFTPGRASNPKPRSLLERVG